MRVFFIFIFMKSLEDKLKNPVWHSLNETHNSFLISYDSVRFYRPEICTFGAFEDHSKTANALDAYSKITERFFVVSEIEPMINPKKIVLEKKIVGCQMVLKGQAKLKVEISENIVLLTEEYIDEIYDLIWLVMPGYYQKRSFEMGKYFGIFKGGKLVSITGQRMQTNDFIEVSAVVTHPDYRKKGYGKQLVAHTTNEILKEGKTPILHTDKGNSAIPLYKNLGYQVTRDMNWWLYQRK